MQAECSTKCCNLRMLCREARVQNARTFFRATLYQMCIGNFEPNFGASDPRDSA